MMEQLGVSTALPGKHRTIPGTEGGEEVSVKIGHASIDELGNAIGGAAGDQNAKEVCTRSWYSNGWNVLLRPVSASLAEKSARACEAACANPCIGYDQGGRNTLYASAKACGFELSKITSFCECDCSSLMHVCAIAGGAKLAYGGNGYTTRTMAAAFVKSGDYQRLTDSKYLILDKHLRRGDILVNEGSHTAMVLDTGVKIQTVRQYVVGISLPILTKGDRSDAVKAMQQLLVAKGYDLPICGADGSFGAETETVLMLYQKRFGIEPNAQCGEKTWNALLGLTGVG